MKPASDLMIAAAKGRADRLPIIIAEWPRNAQELVRISIGRFDNRFTIDIRCWWRDGNAVFKPGRDGLTLDINHLPKLFFSLATAARRAEDWGLVDPFPKAPDQAPTERPTAALTAQPRGRRRMTGVFNR
jgi:hypothetical protein